MLTVAYYAHVVTGVFVVVMFMEQWRGENEQLQVSVLLTEVAHIVLVGVIVMRYMLLWSAVQHQPIEGAAVAFWGMTTVMAITGVGVFLRRFARKRRSIRQGRVIGSPFK